VPVFLGGVVGLLSVILPGVEGGPPFMGDTSLHTFLGYFGLFCTTVRMLRVLAAAWRDGLS
jgi:hypothetical protein